MVMHHLQLGLGLAVLGGERRGLGEAQGEAEGEEEAEAEAEAEGVPLGLLAASAA